MKNCFKIFVFLSLLLAFGNLFSFQPPILLNVNEHLSDSSLVIKYKIENFQNGVEAKINILQKNTKEIPALNEQKIIGDYGKIEEKENYQFEILINLLPDNFNFQEYTAFPKIIFQDRIYYEMEKIEKGKYSFYQDDEKKVFEAAKDFYISKFEVSNEQFVAFINTDGYEIKEYWLVKKGVMANPEVGWNFQGIFNMSAPMDWNLNDSPYWKSAPSNFVYGPVTNLRWFEANAFCNWMGSSLPDLNDISICFSFDSVENDSTYNPACLDIDKNGEFPLHFIRSNVSEWLILSVDSNAPPCGPGCREMFYLMNNSNTPYEFPDKGVSCPLYRNVILGFRYKILCF
ncbi:MAG: SUMF1/EgtB/PvdO family nonheme iron enzyme [Candidatus Cloacimonetes bacterium]|nr:SUMF1/EgtB/PvdO family nonheme iron enzyme [Candidatus Cloacimonadota bacterium]